LRRSGSDDSPAARRDPAGRLRRGGESFR